MQEPTDFIIPRSGHKAEIPKGAATPKLLQIPPHIHSVEDLLAVAGKLNLDNALLLSQREDGAIVYLNTTKMTLSECNWLLDSAKHMLWEDATSVIRRR